MRIQPRLAALVAVVTAAGAAMLAFGFSRADAGELDVLLTLAVLGALAERYAIGLLDSHVSVGVVAVLAAAVLAGVWGVALVVPVIVLFGEWGNGAPWYKRAYNVAAYALAGGAFAGIFQAFGEHAAPDDWPAVVAPALLGAVANFAINSGLVAAAIALDKGEPAVAAWRQRYQWLLPQYLVVGLAAIATATSYDMLGLWGLAVFAAPVVAVRQAYFYGAKAQAPPVERDPQVARAA